MLKRFADRIQEQDAKLAKHENLINYLIRVLKKQAKSEK